jgi:flagellin
MAINPISAGPDFFKSLRSISSTEKASSKTIERVSSGLKVNSFSDSASFAVAQELRSKTQVASALNQGLSNIKGAVSTSLSGVNAISDLTLEIQGKLIELAGSGDNASQTSILRNEVGNLLGQAQTFILNSTFNDVNLIESSALDVSALASDSGDKILVSSQGTVGDSVTTLQTTVLDEAKISNPVIVIQNEFAALQASLSDAAGSLGGVQRTIIARQDSLLDFQQSVNEGLGNLVDANLGRDAALLVAQNVQSQLTNQSLSIANSLASNIVKLFK